MTELTKKNETFSLTPTSLKEAMEYANILSKSSIVPKGYQGKAGDILVAIQMGQEIGLKPIQSLQNIAVINGRPSIYGDACLALVTAHKDCEDIKEEVDDATLTATCTVKRKGRSEVVSKYSKDDAVKAGLWGKQGPWQQYPKRMLQMRARSFALRNAFPDALNGLILAEEAMDYRDVTPHSPHTAKPHEHETNTGSIASRLENISFAEPEPEVCAEKDLITTLKEKVMLYDTDYVLTPKWLQAAGATSLDQLSDEQAQKCIDYIKEKFEA